MKKVLVVDDDPDMRGLLRMVLSPDYEVSEAVDGVEGLEKAKALRPDLLVLDLLMPRMHGFEVCARVRADENLKGTKILISSSKSYRHDADTAVEEAGADGYLVKPFSIEDLKARVDSLIGAAK